MQDRRDQVSALAGYAGAAVLGAVAYQLWTQRSARRAADGSGGAASAAGASSEANDNAEGAPAERVQRLALSEMPPLLNDRLLRAARGEPVDRVPVWCMRQAGRYLPEFRAVRAKHGFFHCCRTPDIAATLTIQPLLRFDLDACVFFSDILIIPQAMGFEVVMEKGVGPVFPRPLVLPQELTEREDLCLSPDLEEKVGYMFDGLNLTRSRLAGRVPLLGFSGAPWTLMCYMVEGKPSKTASKTKAWLYKYPEHSHTLLKALTDVIVPYLIKQVEAGAQGLQIFDTTGVSELSEAHIREFLLPYLVEIGQRVRAAVPGVPLICFIKDACNFPGVMETLSQAYDVLQIDWRVDAATARRRVSCALQGNMDPCALYSDPDRIRGEVERTLQGFGTRGYIANLGHGMHPDFDPEHLRVFIDSVHEVSSAMVSAPLP